MKNIISKSKELTKGKSFILYCYSMAASLPITIVAICFMLMFLAPTLETSTSFGVPILIFSALLILLMMVSAIQFSSSIAYTSIYLNENGYLPPIIEVLKKGFEDLGRKICVVILAGLLLSIISFGSNLIYLVCTLLLIPTPFMFFDEDYNELKFYEILIESISLILNNIGLVLELLLHLIIQSILVYLVSCLLAMTIIGLIFIPLISITFEYQVLICKYNVYLKMKENKKAKELE